MLLLGVGPRGPRRPARPIDGVGGSFLASGGVGVGMGRGLAAIFPRKCIHHRGPLGGVGASDRREEPTSSACGSTSGCSASKRELVTEVSVSMSSSVSPAEEDDETAIPARRRLSRSSLCLRFWSLVM